MCATMCRTPLPNPMEHDMDETLARDIIVLAVINFAFIILLVHLHRKRKGR